MRVRALLYAAGKGERLRPLTSHTPKPLLPVRGEAVAARTLRDLEGAGVEAVAINLHHLGSKIREAFGSSYAGLPLTYSEESELLGSSGALPPLRDFFAPADLILLVNGDTLCDWPFEALIQRHVDARNAPASVGGPPAATVLLTSNPDPAAFGGGVGIDKTGRVLVFRGVNSMLPGHPKVAKRRVFAGAQILEPRLLERIPAGPGDLITVLYEPLLREGAAVLSLTTQRDWFDLGTPERYREAQESWS